MQDRQLDPEGDENEERRLRETAVNSLGEKRGVAILDAIKLLCRIQTRLQGIGADRSPYWSFSTDGTSIEQNRFGLSHLVRWFDDNTSVTIQMAAEDLARLALNTHLRVATAKVAFNRDFRFKVYPDNGELRWVRDVEPAFSQPRLFQARQTLADVGLLASGEAGLKLTADGSEMLKQFDCAL
jgi:hypothetical protein